MSSKQYLTLGLALLTAGILVMLFSGNSAVQGLAYGVMGLTLTFTGLVLKAVGGKTPEFSKALSVASLFFFGAQFIVYGSTVLLVIASATDIIPNFHFLFVIGSILGFGGTLLLLLYGLSDYVTLDLPSGMPRMPRQSPSQPQKETSPGFMPPHVNPQQGVPPQGYAQPQAPRSPMAPTPPGAPQQPQGNWAPPPSGAPFDPNRR